MIILSGAGTWLQQSLLDRCRRGAIQLDADVVTSLVSYCERAPPSDAKEYLSNMIGEANCEDIIAGYLQRRETQGDVADDGGLQDGMQVYVKPQTSEVWSAGSKRITKYLKTGLSDSTTNSLVIDASNGGETTGPLPKSKSAAGKGKKTGKGISLAEATEGKIIMSRGAPCQCQATRHQLVTNCISCGRIVCEQEGEGPCNFCGALVLKEGSTYAGLEGSSAPKSDSEAAAQAFKDRLVEYGRTSSQRTTVIDDQSDYFQVDENAWLSEEEKQAIRQRQEEAQLAEEARKKKVVVSIDLLGRKVVMANDMGNDICINTSILGGTSIAERPHALRIKPNPYILDNPVFVNPKEAGPQSKNVRSNRPSDSHGSKALIKTGRVQHDDPFVYALNATTSERENEDAMNNTWKMPRAKERPSMLSNEDAECFLDFEGKNNEGAVFDICEPQRGKRSSLFPSLLAQKQAERNKRMEGSPAVSILLPGVVLLKRWLSQENQVDIIERCRYLGVGPGGFYQPSYAAEGKLHLRMMCLGMQWEPMTRSYEMKRSIDDASPPCIPPMFETLVSQCLRDARRAYDGAVESCGSSGMEMVPEMHPNICLVNFYERTGKLGLHQDKDESIESLEHGIPVVSFSIGDSGEFIYGLQRDVDLAESVLLESGDVLIFGGPSRMIYHGISSILPQTAPSWLIEKTNLRPGRLNLTFRQL